MFSGITNQVSSWMGSAKGEQEEQVPTPTEDGAAVISAEEKKDTSPTKQSKLDVLTNVKNQFGGWLGSGIPKFRKGEGEQVDIDETRPIGEEGEIPILEKSGKGTPTEEKDGQFGAVSNKALAGAKSIGSFLYSAVNKAGKTVSEASAKIKKTVEENSILGEFNREQDAFVKGKAGSNSDAAVPPWVGCANEESLKEECLSLSTDRRNFVRSPPAGVDFQFDYDISYPIAIATMTEDPNLEKMRFELVPKVISEENFWRNYFYRVSLICQANELSYMGREGENLSTDIGSADSQQLETESNNESNVAPTEFISDTFQASSNDIVQVEEDVKRITLMNRETTEEEWEKELEAELQDYEVVTDTTTATPSKLDNVRNDFWDKDIDAMLDEGDLK
ncbi:Synapse-associated protein 47kD [Carabus blaptoides fortunei]